MGIVARTHLITIPCYSVLQYQVSPHAAWIVLYDKVYTYHIASCVVACSQVLPVTASIEPLIAVTGVYTW